MKFNLRVARIYNHTPYTLYIKYPIGFYDIDNAEIEPCKETHIVTGDLDIQVSCVRIHLESQDNTIDLTRYQLASSAIFPFVVDNTLYVVDTLYIPLTNALNLDSVYIELVKKYYDNTADEETIVENQTQYFSHMSNKCVDCILAKNGLNVIN